MIQMEESLSAFPPAAVSPDSHSFAVACVEAIFAARTAAMARGGQLMKSDLVRIIEKQDAARPRTPVPARLKRFDGPAVKVPMSKIAPLREALAVACGHPGKPGRIAGRQIGIAVADIVEAYPDVTPEELKRRAAIILKKYDKAGVMAIAAHFHECGPGPMTRVAKTSIYVELPNWQEKLRRIAKEMKYDPATVEELLKTPWRDLSVTVREMLLK